MASGTIIDQTYQGMSGLPLRTTNRLAQLYCKGLRNSQDVGYVAGSSVWLRIFLWNGSANDAVLTAIDSLEAEGIEISGIKAGSIIRAGSPAEVLVEVTPHGPIAFAAVFTFLNSCALTPTLTVIGTRPEPASMDRLRPITLNKAMEEAYAYPDPGDTFYDTLEFTDSVSGSSIRIVHSDEELDTPQGLFSACKFECRHPDTEGGVVGAMEISVEFLPKDAQKWLSETCRTRGNVSVYYRQYLGPQRDPDAHYPVPLDVTSVEQTHLGVTVRASFPMLTAMKFPRRIMSITNLPGGRV